MVKITQVYTKTGDKGTTALAGGKRIAKTSQRIEAIGEVDELNSFLGFAAASLTDDFKELQDKIIRIQNELFNLGAQLSVLAEDRRPNTPLLQESNIKTLEDEIDRMNANLPKLLSFILPGGGEISTRFHLARAVCRRAERAIVNLSENEKLDGTEIPYLNRLSDWLFVTARYVAQQLQVEEKLWHPENNPH